MITLSSNLPLTCVDHLPISSHSVSLSGLILRLIMSYTPNRIAGGRDRLRWHKRFIRDIFLVWLVGYLQRACMLYVVYLI